MLKTLFSRLPEKTQASLLFFAFSRFKVAMIGHAGTKLLSVDQKEVLVEIPLTRRTRNHLNSMYFGSLCIGADVAGGILAVMLLQKSKERVDFVFKDCYAQFLKRAESRVVFRCSDGERIMQAVRDTIASKERVDIPVDVFATAPDTLGEEVVAKFRLTLSMKVRGQKKYA